MMGSKGRMRDPPGIVRWNASYWLESSLCEKQYKCHFLTRSHISSIFRQFLSLLVQLKSSLRISWAEGTSQGGQNPCTSCRSTPRLPAQALDEAHTREPGRMCREPASQERGSKP